MKPKKLPNGKYRLRIYDYQDSSGKQHVKTFTADSRQECIRLASDYKSKKVAPNEYKNLLFKDACEMYIESRSNILSPASLKKYKFMQRNYDFFDGFKLKDIDSNLVQNYVNSISKDLSYKSVKDRYALLRSILASYSPFTELKVDLPRKVKTDRYLPENDDVLKYINATKDPMFKLAICLGAYGMMREGEISAFQKEDLNGNILHIHRNMVKAENGFVIKSPKTYESDRHVPLPDFVADMIREMPNDTIGLTPNAIANRWNRLRKKLDVPNFRFHDLRAYGCSTYLDRGVSSAITQKVGGWANPTTMQNVYDRAVLSSLARETADINKFFEDLNKKNQSEE